MVFINAHVGPRAAGDPESMFTVHFFDENGNTTIRKGGTRAWRCNNPGALIKSHYSIGKDRRAIGCAGYGKYEYAVYPDYETGHEALIVMLKGSQYSKLTLKEASEKYVREDPDHIHKIAKMSKLDSSRTIKSLSDEEFIGYWKAIEQNERWSLGEEIFIEKWHISAVHKKRGIIYEYLVVRSQESLWISKVEAIALALQKQLYAVIVHSTNGINYLRPHIGLGSFRLDKVGR